MERKIKRAVTQDFDVLGSPGGEHNAGSDD